MKSVNKTISLYVCNRCPCGAMMTESLVFMSEDLKHNHHVEQAFVQTAVYHLKHQQGLHISHIVKWMDGSGSQNKCKDPFVDISYTLQDVNCALERIFFLSRHGKGPSDGKSEMVKRQVIRVMEQLLRHHCGRDTRTVKGTWAFHTVKCMEKGKLLTRCLTSTCQPCMSGTDTCLNVTVLGP